MEIPNGLGDAGSKLVWLLQIKEKPMTKASLVCVALINAVLFTNQAMAACHGVGKRHIAAKAHETTGCIRAPNVGAFASDPYTSPPCVPNPWGDMIQ
ncbi:hypothetical protein BRADO5891 [Bradyrhizobium sp. ORS 278]|uniref:hypothetical protein n=1 Tax=Bradyrhizobium sp. (strain ORS 278) TaxID=114615 RepID=UPI0001508AFF|nr:hypothetical protein [Bradyrhizobium sp. ORS 278]CAL79555.1 hypothetical protein BRADO5891 [Bradyrhizobium sp. ORS 278]